MTVKLGALRFLPIFVLLLFLLGPAAVSPAQVAQPDAVAKARDLS